MRSTCRGSSLWQKDLGVLNTGAYDLPEYEWGTASSPIIYKDLVIVQCDTQNESFVLARRPRDRADGVEDRAQELPSWGTPTVYVPDKRRPRAPELVTNASNFIRGYDPDTGAELLAARRQLEDYGADAGFSPTASSSSRAAARRSGRSSRSVRARRGDITLRPSSRRATPSSGARRGRGSYMPTPLIYQGVLYVLAKPGCSTPTSSTTGARSVYRQRMPHQGSGFSASPVAADGRIYLSSEDGDMFVVRGRHGVRAGRDELDGGAADGDAGDRRRAHVRARRAASVRDRQDRKGSEVSAARPHVARST